MSNKNVKGGLSREIWLFGARGIAARAYHLDVWKYAKYRTRWIAYLIAVIMLAGYFAFFGLFFNLTKTNTEKYLAINFSVIMAPIFFVCGVSAYKGVVKVCETMILRGMWAKGLKSWEGKSPLW